MKPRDVVCPNCNAQPGHPCTQPTDTTRVATGQTHWARIARAEHVDEPDPGKTEECRAQTWTDPGAQGHLCRRPKGHPDMHECHGCDMRWSDR